MKRLFTLLMALVLIMLSLTLLPTQAQAASSGTCGANLIWTLDSKGVLTISGTGNMYSYTHGENPWYLDYNVKSIVIKEGVTSIGNYAFSACTKALSISIPSTVTKIGEDAFQSCESLRSVVIPYGVKMIPMFCFSNCISLESVSIPSSVHSFGQSAFKGCSSLISFCIPNGVTQISDGMFWNCSSLEKVYIPNSVTKIDTFAFHGCGNLSDVYYGGTSSKFSNIEINLRDEYNEGLNYAEYHWNSTICAFDGHSWNGGSVTRPATCAQMGIKTYTCTGCNTTKTETIAKTSHTYGSWTRVSDTQHSRTCSICNNVEKVNHAWNSGKVTKQPTCKETGVKTYTCTACNATKTETIAKSNEHKYSNWTKVNDTTHKHTCSVCAKEETANHSWNSTITKKATCKEDGIKTYTCTACNATKTETIAKLTTHTYDHACDTDCNVCGVTRSTTHDYKTSWSKDKTNHWHECSVCKDKKDIAAHTPGAEATETTAQTCTTCSYVIKAALGHTHKYATTWTTDENGHWYACSGCEEKGNYAAHTPGAEATATTDQTCTVCGYVLKEATGETEPAPQPTEPTSTPVVPTEPAGDSEISADPTVWIIVAVAVVVLGGGAGADIIIWKKKH